MQTYDQRSKDFHQEYEQLSFTTAQAALLLESANSIAAAGGSELPGAIALADTAASRIYLNLSPQQRCILKRYADGKIAALEYNGLVPPSQDSPPAFLPALEILEADPICLHLAARSQILLHLVQNRAFALDVENDGKTIRFVGNFSGTTTEPPAQGLTEQDRNSHTGLGLGPHTEAPYHCAVEAVDGHSPAPSTLILTARWNPSNEPTSIIPMGPVIDRIGSRATLALTSSSFDFARSGSSTTTTDGGGYAVPILQFDSHGEFCLRYNSYRHSLNTNACRAARKAFDALNHEVSCCEALKCTLTPTNALMINNYRSLHCRELIRDNRRLLIRLFGYSRFGRPIVLKRDPLTVQG